MAVRHPSVGLPEEVENRLSLLEKAIEGERGPDQQRIADHCLKWAETLLQKNKDYGSSAWKRPVLMPELDERAAIFVRMSDKIERICALRNTKAEITAESLEDTISDLGAYCLLWLACPITQPST